uniref:Uncharacterized protein n=1 Tax=Triticum urartu TaxID=4572 RepID=A0A8R7QDV8_TRIUA
MHARLACYRCIVSQCVMHGLLQCCMATNKYKAILSVQGEPSLDVVTCKFSGFQAPAKPAFL